MKGMRVMKGEAMGGKKRAMSRRSFITGALGTAAVMSVAGGSIVGCAPTGQEGQKEGPTGAAVEKWVPTTCNMCFNNCAILVRVVDGIAMEIKGNPNSTVGGGRLCAKGASGIMQLYDPYRITKPLIRTNPEKGIGIDPGWEEITWEEAMGLYIGKLAAYSAEDQRYVAGSSMVSNLGTIYARAALNAAMGGMPETAISDICGSGTHGNQELLTATGNASPDYAYCNYVVQFGIQAGTATRHGFNMTAKMFADRRAEGCKLVNFDPHMSAAGDKADEWIPLVPGTDAVVALAMAHVLANELGVYDRDFLTNRSNGPSLVDTATGRVIRDAGTNKALYWDEDTSSARPYDEAVTPALEGSFEVDGEACKTAWTLNREHLETYTPEYAESISTVPAASIRRIAREFGEAACIGQTIDIEGYTLPYRPVAVDSFSGVSRHKHSWLSNWACLQLNTIVGSCNAVGGYIGFGPKCNGYSDTSPIQWAPGVWEEDGLINYTSLISPASGPESMYEAVRSGISVPETKDMLSLMPFGMDYHFYYINQKDPSIFNNLCVKSKMLIAYGCNPLKWWGDFEDQEQLLKDYEYVIGSDLYLTDASYYFDLFIPEATYLERYDVFEHMFLAHRHLGGLDSKWNFLLRQPVVEARDGCLGNWEFCCEAAWMAGPESNAGFATVLNYVHLIMEHNPLPTDQKITPEMVLDAGYKTYIDDKHDLAWFKENGSYIYPRKADEVYIWADGSEGRVPIYMDIMFEAKEKVGAIVEEYQIPWELDDYQPLPDWKPCPDFEVTDPDYTIMPIYWTNQSNVDTWSVYNAYLNELNESDPYGYAIEVNSATAAEKGIKDGDAISLTNIVGKSVSGIAMTSEAVHPQCVSVIGGHWNSRSEFIPTGKGKGTGIVDLVYGSLDPIRYDHLCNAFDQCVRVKLEKV